MIAKICVLLREHPFRESLLASHVWSGVSCFLADNHNASVTFNFTGFSDNHNAKRQDIPPFLSTLTIILSTSLFFTKLHPSFHVFLSYTSEGTKQSPALTIELNECRGWSRINEPPLLGAMTAVILDCSSDKPGKGRAVLQHCSDGHDLMRKIMWHLQNAACRVGGIWRFRDQMNSRYTIYGFSLP